MIYDKFTADSIARHLCGAISCLRCKMMWVPDRRTPNAERRECCPFCEIFDVKGVIDLPMESRA